MPAETLRDLRPAKWNPRTITPRQREALRRSLLEYGDLSGIVKDVRSGLLVGGHQRTDVLKDRNARIHKRPHRDSTGTVAIGEVVVPLSGGGALRIPYREVDWPIDRTMGANLAANAAGGEFDDVKLGRILARLESRRFPIESIPLDGVLLQRAVREHRRQAVRDEERGGTAQNRQFEGVDIEAIREAADFQCPSCGYRIPRPSTPSFTWLDKMTDDNPTKVEALHLAREVRRMQQRTGEDQRTAGRRVAEERARAQGHGRKHSQTRSR